MSVRIAVPPMSPVLRRHAEERARNLQNRVADRITAFAGSMAFVYLHIVLFAIWMLLLEKSPWPTLTLIVSLEAIFLSTFVMISQNRADAKHQVLANHQWDFVQQEEKQNETLIDLSNKILDLTRAIHRLTVQRAAGGGDASEAPTPPTSPAG